MVVGLAASALWIVLFMRPPSLPLAFRSILILTLLLRVPMMFVAPGLSGDVWRYLWDGSVSLHGINPYEAAPEDPSFQGLQKPWHGEINHPEIRTAYPPYAQLLFLIPAFFGGTLTIWRLLLFLIEIWVIRMLYRDSPWMALLWATFPLAVWEGVWNAHLDLVAGAVLLGAIALVQRPLLSGIVLALATGVKVFPAVSVPVFVVRSRRPVEHLAAVAVTLGLAIVPFIGRPFMAGFHEYAERWSFNGLVYTPLVSVLEFLSIDAILRDLWSAIKDPLGLEPISRVVYSHLYPEFLARGAIAALLVGGLVLIARRSTTLSEGVADSLGFLMLVSPTVHPWYWLPVSMIAIGAGRSIWLFLAAGSVSSYLLYESVSPAIVLGLSYGVPVAAFALVQRGRRRLPG